MEQGRMKEVSNEQLAVSSYQLAEIDLPSYGADHQVKSPVAELSHMVEGCRSKHQGVGGQMKLNSLFYVYASIAYATTTNTEGF